MYTMRIVPIGTNTSTPLVFTAASPIGMFRAYTALYDVMRETYRGIGGVSVDSGSGIIKTASGVSVAELILLSRDADGWVSTWKDWFDFSFQYVQDPVANSK